MTTIQAYSNAYESDVDMDPREHKAREIALDGHITAGPGHVMVRSQSGPGWYRIAFDGVTPISCTCPDFELRARPCKHMLGYQLWAKSVNTQTKILLPQEKVKRPTYRQNWPCYELAQTREKDHFQELLHELCSGIAEPKPKGGAKGGRPTVSLADQSYAGIFKVYSGFSARRFMCDLRAAHAAGYLSRPLGRSSVINALENPELTPILHTLIQQTSLPLQSVETFFAVDSSGFSTSRFTRWYDIRYGVPKQRADWVKVHVMCGVVTNVVTAVQILEKNAGDAPQFPALLQTTAEIFDIKEVSADAAYPSIANFLAAEKVGATAYIPFTSRMTGSVGGVFQKAFHFFSLHREEFLQHYHRRSNVESTFSMIKRKFGDSLRSKTDTAMTNEVLAKIVCHNLSCLIHAMYELGIVPVFWQGKEPGQRDVLPIVRP